MLPFITTILSRSLEWPLKTGWTVPVVRKHLQCRTNSAWSQGCPLLAGTHLPDEVPVMSGHRPIKDILCRPFVYIQRISNKNMSDMTATFWASHIQESPTSHVFMECWRWLSVRKMRFLVNHIHVSTAPPPDGRAWQ